MIIANGTIEIKTSIAGGIDPITRYPIPTTEEWSGSIPCQYIAQAENNVARSTLSGSSYNFSQYKILIDEIKPFKAHFIRLKNEEGETIGEYPVVRINTLKSVCQICIWV